MSRRNKKQLEKLSKVEEPKKITVTIELTPDQSEQLDRLCKLDHNSKREIYCQKVITHHIANRWKIN